MRVPLARRVACQLNGDLRRMIEGTKPMTTYWPTLKVADYDAAERLP
jgi:hypothetical protein